MNKRNLLWAIPLCLAITACGGSETENTDNSETTDSAPVEAAIAYGPFMTSEEVAKTERIESLDAFNAVEDKSTVIRYVTSSAKTAFPTELLDAYNLQVLSINVDGELPEELGKFKNLTTLCLGGNFTALPESVGELQNLKTVSFEYCKDLDLEQALSVLINCQSIQYLNINSMGLTELPASIGDLKNLKHLRVGSNALTTLPESLYTLPGLEHLRIGKNEGMDYTAVLTSAKALPALNTLWLQYCGFTTLPSVLGEYPSLNTIHWREEWNDKNAEQIKAVCAKEGKKFPNVNVTWDSMSGMFYDIY